MPTAICGMHRSGTSMITNLLRQCGMHLGPEEQLILPKPDNPAGFWENIEMLKVNEQVLAAIGGAWDMPPAQERIDQLAIAPLPIDEEAKKQIAAFGDKEPWGWKDPRNSLTLPFWKRLISDVRVVFCVRNPLEVYLSLNRRNGTSALLSMTLWFLYNMAMVKAVKEVQYVVTHYDSYFNDPRGELQRVTNFLGMQLDEQTLDKASGSVDSSLRHSSYSVEDLKKSGISQNVIQLYEELCRMAGPHFSA